MIQTKKQLAQSISAFTQAQLNDFNALLSCDMPCRIVGFPIVSGAFINTSIVEVAFEVATDLALPTVIIPVETSLLVRAPLSIGDKGLARMVSGGIARLGGLGGGVPEFLQFTANLNNRVFVPIGHADAVAVKSNLFTSLVPISDNTNKTTPTMLRTNGDDIVNKINEIAAWTRANGSGIANLSGTKLAESV